MATPCYVYILTNPGIPHAIKIGYTTRKPEERAKELSGTGVVHPFQVAHSAYFIDGTDVEKRLHRKFERYRIKTNREFFKVPVDTAVEALKSIKSTEPTGEFVSAYELYLAGQAFQEGIHGYPQHYELAKACYRMALTYGHTELNTLIRVQLANCLIVSKGITADIELADTLIQLLSSHYAETWLLIGKIFFIKSNACIDRSDLSTCYDDFGNCLLQYLRLVDYTPDTLSEQSAALIINATLKAINLAIPLGADTRKVMASSLGFIHDTESFSNLSNQRKEDIQQFINVKEADQ